MVWSPTRRQMVPELVPDVPDPMDQLKKGSGVTDYEARDRAIVALRHLRPAVRGTLHGIRAGAMTDFDRKAYLKGISDAIGELPDPAVKKRLLDVAGQALELIAGGDKPKAHHVTEEAIQRAASALSDHRTWTPAGVESAAFDPEELAERIAARTPSARR
jgi:hypothetical protein